MYFGSVGKRTLLSAGAGTPQGNWLDRSRAPECERRSVGLDHPFAATGARILGAAAKQPAQHQRQTGRRGRTLVSICAEGGLGATAIFGAGLGRQRLPVMHYDELAGPHYLGLTAGAIRAVRNHRLPFRAFRH
jgi:hypothetical protein